MRNTLQTRGSPHVRRAEAGDGWSLKASLVWPWSGVAVVRRWSYRICTNAIHAPDVRIFSRARGRSRRLGEPQREPGVARTRRWSYRICTNAIQLLRQGGLSPSGSVARVASDGGLRVAKLDGWLDFAPRLPYLYTLPRLGPTHCQAALDTIAARRVAAVQPPGVASVRNVLLLRTGHDGCCGHRRLRQHRGGGRGGRGACPLLGRPLICRKPESLGREYGR